MKKINRVKKYSIITKSIKEYRENDELAVYFFTAVILSIISLIGFIDIIVDYVTNGYWGLDKIAAQFVSGIRNEGFTILFKSITYTGNFVSIFLITIAIMLFLSRKSKRDSLFFGASILGVWILNELIKFVVKRPRPIGVRLVNVSGYSFPSGHAMIFMALALLFIYSILIYNSRKMGMIILCCLIFLYSMLVGFSRVYVGVHYLSDVIAGWFAGTLWSSLCVAIHRTVLVKRV